MTVINATRGLLPLLLALLVVGCGRRPGLAPAFEEICGNGLDDDGNGLPDDECECAPGAEQPCFAGAPAQAGVGACEMGTQRCDTIVLEGGVEVYHWGPCQGWRGPSAEVCDGAVDDDCDGEVDNGCDCVDGETTPCESVCGPGAERCVDGAWQACDAPLPTGGSVWATRSPWEMHPGGGIVPYGYCTDTFGAVEEYAFAAVPPMSDPGWGPAPDPDVIGFSIPSTLCGVLDCRCGGDFTYFRTFVDVAPDATIGSFVIEMTGMDDGVRTTIFNPAHPDGVTVEEGYVFLGGSATANLAPYIQAGAENTLLLTHVDDCCAESNLNVARIVIDGLTGGECP